MTDFDYTVWAKYLEDGVTVRELRTNSLVDALDRAHELRQQPGVDAWVEDWDGEETDGPVSIEDFEDEPPAKPFGTDRGTTALFLVS